MSGGHDRGAFHSLNFKRCHRGFTLEAYDMQRDHRGIWAFDRIEDLANWLIEQYGNPPALEEKGPANA